MDYVYKNPESISSDLLCSICMVPLIDPVDHSNTSADSTCSQQYCNKCVRTQKLCPHCRTPVNKWNPVVVNATTRKFLFKPLDSLKVICPVCNGAVERSQLEIHISNCPTKCPSGCGKLVSPKEQDGHKTMCTHEVIHCTAESVMCPWKGQRGKLEVHQSLCHFYALYPILHSLQQQNQQQQQQILQLQQRDQQNQQHHQLFLNAEDQMKQLIEHQKDQMEQQKDQMELQMYQIQLQKDQMELRMEQQRDQIEQLMDQQGEQQKNQIEQLRDQMRGLMEQQQREQQNNQIEQLMEQQREQQNNQIEQLRDQMRGLLEQQQRDQRRSKANRTAPANKMHSPGVHGQKD